MGEEGLFMKETHGRPMTALLPEEARRELIGRLALEIFSSKDFDSYHHWNHSVKCAIASVENMEGTIAIADSDQQRRNTINRLDQLPRRTA